MTDWATFAGFAGVVLAALLLLAHASKELIDSTGRVAAPAGHVSAEGLHADPGPEPTATAALSPGVLLLNVALSQGLLWMVLLVGAWLSGVPASAVGAAGLTPGAVGVGVALGGTLYVLNEVGASVSRRAGLGTADELRAALAPSTTAGWAVLLLVVLPVIAGFEEFLFRGVLVGAMSVGFGTSPWLLAVVSSVAFGLGHGAQGPGGIAVTAVLGFVFAGAFVLTGSLLVVFVAHYLVNALEFVVHEGLGVDWAPG